MLKDIDKVFTSGFPSQDFAKLDRIYTNSSIVTVLSGKRTAVAYDFVTDPNYPDGTIFKGFGNNNTWISLNLDGISNKLLLHTTMTDPLGTDVTVLHGFQPGAHLYEVGNISEPVNVLIGKVNSIVQRLK